MVEERRWSDADRELVVGVMWTRALQGGNAGVGLDPQPAGDAPPHMWADVAAVLDALTAAGWRPPPPEPDGVHWRTGSSVGRTVYDPQGRLVGLLDTPEQAQAAVDALNADTGSETA